MKSPESYRKEYPKSAESKFAIPRNKDGEPNPEVFKITKDFVEKLSKYPSFIGAAPYGSKMRGYSNEDSDTDIAIFTQPPTDSNSTDQHAEQYELRRDALEATYAHGGPDAIHIQYYDLDENAIKHSIANHNFYPGRMALASFFGVVSGPKIDEYRKLIAELVNALPEDKRDKFIKDMILMALSLENSRKSTVEERITETKEAPMETLRKPVWEKRIHDILTKHYK